MATRWLTILSSASRTLRGRTCGGGLAFRGSADCAARELSLSRTPQIAAWRSNEAIGLVRHAENAELATQTRIIVTARRCQHHDGRAGQVGALANLPGELEAVHLRHLRVEQDQRERIAATRPRGQRLSARRRWHDDRASSPSGSAARRGCADSFRCRPRPAPAARPSGPSWRVDAAVGHDAKLAVKWNVLPWPGSLSTQIRPPISSHQARRDRRAQPGAAEPARRRAVGLRERLEDRCVLAPAGMPMPVSLHDEVQRAAEPSAIASQLDLARPLRRCSVNLMALPTRLTRTCRSRPGSPTSASGTSAAMSREQLEALLVAPHGERLRRCRRRRRAGEKAIVSSSSLPASIFEKSRMSLRMAEQRLGRGLDRLEVLALLGVERRCRAPARSCR